MKRIIKNNLSIFLMGFGSICYFLASFIAKKNFDENEFYIWNVFITVVGVSYTFCYFGSEQLLLRLSKLQGSNLSVSRNLIYVMFITNIVYTILMTFVLNEVIFDTDLIGFFVVISISVAILVFVYNYFRLIGNYLISQLVNNLWKFISVIFVILLSSIGVEFLASVTMLLSFSLALLIFYYHRHFFIITGEKLPHDWKALLGGFCFSLFSLVLINNLDRLIVESHLTNEMFSSFVYLMNVLVMPFSLISSYFGFKEVTLLKKKYNKRSFHAKNIKLALFSAILFLVWFVIVYFTSNVTEVDINIEYLIPCLILVVSKCSYSMFSALFGLMATANQIKKVNILTLFPVLIVFMFPYVFSFDIDFIIIIYGVALVWIFRCLTFLLFTYEIKDFDLEKD